MVEHKIWHSSVVTMQIPFGDIFKFSVQLNDVCVYDDANRIESVHHTPTHTAAAEAAAVTTQSRLHNQSMISHTHMHTHLHNSCEITALFHGTIAKCLTHNLLQITRKLNTKTKKRKYRMK